MKDPHPELSLVRDLTAQGLEVEETHISRVFLGKDQVWKVKKPVDFGYLDYSTPERRRKACEAEVALNRRFSPETYLGVVPVTLDGNGVHRLGGEGRPVEWAVHMVRLSAADRGDRRLMNGTLSIPHLENLACRLAAFHAGHPGDSRTIRFGDPEAVALNLEENFNQARDILYDLLSPAQASILETGLLGFLRDHGAAFRERVRKGRVRDGHGDLRLGQVYFDDRGGSAILDCIEFNDRFRFGDVCSDVSFLAMDLAVRGRTDLAEVFLAAYARESGDYDLYSLADFYESYRACVRGKIAGYRARNPGASAPERAAARREAGAYFRFALSLVGRPPAAAPLIAIGGGLATGKSTLAAALGRSLGIPVLGSDRTRKQLAGIDPWERQALGFKEGIYHPSFTERVYAELRRRAKVVLDSGRPVILDATFRSRAQRSALKDLARRNGHPVLFLECRAGRERVQERLRRRGAGPGISDGREDIEAAYREEEEGKGTGNGWEAEGWSEGVVVDTSRPLEECLEKAERLLDWRRA